MGATCPFGAETNRGGWPAAPGGYAGPMARPLWTGSISFGLVNVPVKAYTAVRDHDVHFNQLEKKTGARIRNKKVSEKTGREVDSADIEMGFEISKGRYVTFDKDELEELKPESTRAIDVTDFVDLEAVDPIYYERTYWLGPADDDAKEAYGLLLAAMDARSKVAIGTVVMRNKQYLAAIRPLNGALAMSTMRFADEVVPRSEVDGVPRRVAKPEAKALKLATQIVDSLAGDWKPEQYHDTYAEELRTRIGRKDKGKDVVDEAPAADTGAQILDLMEALEQSVADAKGRRGGARSAATRKKASSRTTKAKAKGRKSKSTARKSA
jgi:DNA end-binding protein Ku